MTSRKKGLGKGLGALIPLDNVTDDAGSESGPISIPLAAIRPNPHQPRSEIRDQDVVELAASIEAHGVIQPLIVAREEDGYILIAGERRWRASRLAGLPAVPVIVKDVVPQQMLELALVENVQREDLNPLEEAHAYRQLIDGFGLTHEEVARRVGKSRVAVSNTMRLLKAAQPVQAKLIQGKISEGHARALLALEEEAQVVALQTVLAKDLTVRQTEDLVRRLREPAAPPKKAAQPSPEIKAAEARLRAALSAKVRLAPGKKGGRIIIYYNSDQELNDLYDKLT